MRTVPIVAALLFYMLALVDLTLFEYPLAAPTPNLVPFRTIYSDLSGAGPGIWANFSANLVLLTPLGILLPALHPRRIGWKTTALACLIVSSTIEVGQYLGGSRVADIDDILLDVLSGLIGFAMFGAACDLFGLRKPATIPARIERVRAQSPSPRPRIDRGQSIPSTPHRGLPGIIGTAAVDRESAMHARS